VRLSNIFPTALGEGQKSPDGAERGVAINGTLHCSCGGATDWASRQDGIGGRDVWHIGWTPLRTAGDPFDHAFFGCYTCGSIYSNQSPYERVGSAAVEGDGRIRGLKESIEHPTPTERGDAVEFASPADVPSDFDGQFMRCPCGNIMWGATIADGIGDRTTWKISSNSRDGYGCTKCGRIAEPRLPWRIIDRITVDEEGGDVFRAYAPKCPACGHIGWHIVARSDGIGDRDVYERCDRVVCRHDQHYYACNQCNTIDTAHELNEEHASHNKTGHLICPCGEAVKFYAYEEEGIGGRSTWRREYPKNGEYFDEYVRRNVLADAPAYVCDCCRRVIRRGKYDNEVIGYISERDAQIRPPIMEAMRWSDRFKLTCPCGEGPGSDSWWPVETVEGVGGRSAGFDDVRYSLERHDYDALQCMECGRILGLGSEILRGPTRTVRLSAEREKALQDENQWPPMPRADDPVVESATAQEYASYHAYSHMPMSQYYLTCVCGEELVWVNSGNERQSIGCEGCGRIYGATAPFPRVGWMFESAEPQQFATSDGAGVYCVCGRGLVTAVNHTGIGNRSSFEIGGDGGMDFLGCYGCARVYSSRAPYEMVGFGHIKYRGDILESEIAAGTVMASDGGLGGVRSSAFTVLATCIAQGNFFGQIKPLLVMATAISYKDYRFPIYVMDMEEGVGGRMVPKEERVYSTGLIHQSARTAIAAVARYERDGFIPLQSLGGWDVRRVT
jgi:hypothetical protein